MLFYETIHLYSENPYEIYKQKIKSYWAYYLTLELKWLETPVLQLVESTSRNVWYKSCSEQKMFSRWLLILSFAAATRTQDVAAGSLLRGTVNSAAD